MLTDGQGQVDRYSGAAALLIWPHEWTAVFGRLAASQKIRKLNRMGPTLAQAIFYKKKARDSASLMQRTETQNKI